MTSAPTPEALRTALTPRSLDDEATALAVEIVERYLASGSGFKGPFEDFCEIIEPALVDALGSARRDGAHIANEGFAIDRAALEARLADVEKERDALNQECNEDLEHRLAKECELSATRAECDALKGEVERLERDNDRQDEALKQIAQWADAYPLGVFPEPDWENARVFLDMGGMTLDSIAASCMRRAIEGVGKIARAALAQEARDE